MNSDQSDGDSDDAGDVCDNCPDDSNGTQTDGDEDGAGDVCDNCVGDSNPDQSDFDSDGFGDVCETGSILTDINISLRVDGFDLAALGRAFGSQTADDNYSEAADLNRDGWIEGMDLDLLSVFFGHDVE